MNNQKGILAIISGFSGAGKGTVVKKILESHNEEFALSISATTRSPREGEVNGVHYFFMDKAVFEQKISDHQFLEYAQYVDNYYGTPKEFVFAKLDQGVSVILEIEMQGGLKVKEQCPEAVLIFMVPPSAEELKNRLIGRGTEDIETVNKRLRRASEEIDYIDDYDYIVVNNEIEKCAEDINAIICSEHNKVLNNSDMISIIKDDFKLLK